MPEGKIIKALSGFYYVLSNSEVYQCRGRGVFRKRNISPLVGDYVTFEPETMTEGTVVEIAERKNELIRPPIANVDQAILVFSATQPQFSDVLLDRFLVLVEAKHLKPIICISKVDLLSDEELKNIVQYKNLYESIGYDVLLTSTETKEGIEQLRPFLEKGVSVFAGQSGVGKSSMLNALNEELNLETNEISSHLGRGKHTTRHVELMPVGDGFVADTPGFSSLDFEEMEPEDLTLCFPEMREVMDNCKFRGCLHQSEPKCAVKAAVEEGTISAARYKHYEAFLAEIKEQRRY
ncbi:ribosome small subunit-dependent GTPase A [Lottiidibacillus patelloidae]|uniref:Small ribosomal subunit biogenesis GTPase RsgA n=1 Tax=Lottiidibacillus patelloidae TaxID=2670334 RepID=A0A263BY05_9BACI|nr:ribosome small subunit-dependent GTPase A [Lottiidibacillus patelloidae]OZM58550.1 ribosome small subunit-dependent GTPase A [Lottiidibacillus patelloidae]